MKISGWSGRMWVWLVVVGFALASRTVASGAPSGAVSAQHGQEVHIKNFNFAPLRLVVPVGTTVTWVNQDDEPHTVTSSSDTRVFSSPPLDTNGTFSFTFATPGTYRYFCEVHPQMVGTIVVK